VTPTGGYTGTVILNCSNLPANAVCEFWQDGGGANTITLSGNQAAGVSLTIETNVQQVAAAPAEQNRQNPILPALAICFPGGLLGLAVFSRRSQKDRRKRLLGIGLLVLMTGSLAVALTGCVSNTSSITTTPPGVSTITVISAAPAGSDGLSQSANLTLTVTQ
jgi:hypothetical protein